MRRWLLGTRNKKEQMNQSEGVLLRNTNEGCRSWSCELPCAFGQCFTKLFLLGKVAALGTPELELWPLASMGRRQTPPPHPPPPKDSGSGIWAQEWKWAAAALPLAWGRHGIWQRHGGSHRSCEAAAVWGSGLLPHMLESNQARTASQRRRAGMGKEEVSVMYCLC